MYCENCGKKIDDDAIFCEHCGTRLKESKNKLETQLPKELSRENKTIIVIIIIIGFVFLFFLELKFFNSPDNAIHNYLKNWENKNYDNILESLNISDSKFTSKEVFSKVYPDLNEFNIIDFKVSGCEVQKNKNKAICHITYTTDKKGISYEKDYILEKKEKNRLFLFANWEVIQSDFKVTNDFLLYTPTGSQIYLMNQNLEEYQIKEEMKKGYDCYKIPSIFQGIYPLKVVLENGMSLEKNISITNKDYTYKFNLKDASQELINELENLGKEVVETIYQGIMKKENFESLKINYKIEEIKNTYELLKKDLEESGLTKFEINEIKITNMEMMEDNNLSLSFRMNYRYDLKDGEKLHSGESNDSFYITLKNLETKEILKLESLVTYFSKKY